MGQTTGEERGFEENWRSGHLERGRGAMDSEESAQGMDGIRACLPGMSAVCRT